jgi:hypothetical protein
MTAALLITLQRVQLHNTITMPRVNAWTSAAGKNQQLLSTGSAGTVDAKAVHVSRA